ncbi:hypothetical protein Cgig2_010110 [Carnegiea gigantea]|uniref:B box-type domain-containing protein n=1 Tax=Carnegiea gigantea TaxID=171969 RepID=A0A9Q1K5N6_9CARY|nr:hypothetical protein Cgig2_010110 [Carnegiea gigantea]
MKSQIDQQEDTKDFIYEVKDKRLTYLRRWQLNLNQVNARITSRPSQAPLSQKDHGKKAKKCLQALHHQKDHEREAKECVQALQLLKGHEKQSNQCTQVGFIKGKPEWIERFVRRTFFDHCSEHPIRRNELNKYCIDCDAPLCQYCLPLSSHAGHRLLKIYRHVYKDVVLLDEIKQHIDCSQIQFSWIRHLLYTCCDPLEILGSALSETKAYRLLSNCLQPYRCNKQMVVALTPLPHTGSKTNEEGTCHSCKRKLIEFDSYSYCSMSCKVEAFTKKDNDYVPPFLALVDPAQKAGETKTGVQVQAEASTEKNDDFVPPVPALEQSGQKAKEETITSFRTRKRKGTPHRAPFF